MIFCRKHTNYTLVHALHFVLGHLCVFKTVWIINNFNLEKLNHKRKNLEKKTFLLKKWAKCCQTSLPTTVVARKRAWRAWFYMYDITSMSKKSHEKTQVLFLNCEKINQNKIIPHSIWIEYFILSLMFVFLF